ncbi:classical arabinogalactan protein 9 [Plutella xylostella]|nr:classical arabinogalactan protein 9 [Plutella xylostella]
MAAASPHAHSASAPDRRSEGRAGSRRIFPPQFKLQVLEAYRRDAQCRGNQRATARKFGIHRRQIQKWLQAEPALRAALLRRAPQPAPSPPPYSAGSPESARLPSPPPAVSLPSPVQITTPMCLPQVPATQPPPPPCLPIIAEPIDLSVRRASPPPQSANVPLNSTSESPRKPFKLFRPYLLEDEIEKRPAVTLAMPLTTSHVSAFVPVHSYNTGCSLAACPAPRWCAPMPAYGAPLR